MTAQSSDNSYSSVHASGPQREASVEAAVAKQIKPAASPDRIDSDANDDAGEQGVAFRLFAPTAGGESAGPIQFIRLRSPTPQDQDSDTDGITFQPRPIAFYRSRTLSDALAAEYEAAALTGTQVMALSQRHYPGLICPWKVISADKCNITDSSQSADQKTKRTRAGKKTRLRRRMKLADAIAKQQKELEALAEKERHLREKKTRTNRDKKLKKRARDKLKKTLGTRPDGDDPDDDDHNDDNDSNDDEDA